MRSSRRTRRPALAALIALVALGGFVAVATRARTAAAGGEEPVLEGEAKKKHDEQVHQLVADLRSEKNKVLVKSHVERLGSSGSRVDRDALIEFSRGLKNQEYLSYCFRALAKIGGPKVIDFLTGKDALRSPDFLTAQQAAESLATTKDPSAAGALLDVITNPSTKSEVLGAAAIAVAQVAPKDERVAETLMAMTKAVKDMARTYGAEALGYLATDAAVARLVDILQNEKNAGVRGGAARGLGATKRPDVIPHLEASIASENSLQVKDAASRAIERIRSGR